MKTALLKNAQKLAGNGLGAEAARALNGQRTKGATKAVKRDGIMCLTPESSALWVAKHGNTLVRLVKNSDGMNSYAFSTPMGQGNVGYARDIVAQSAAKSGLILVPKMNDKGFIAMDRSAPSEGESSTNSFSLSPKVQKRVRNLAGPKLGAYYVLDQSTQPGAAPQPGALPAGSPLPMSGVPAVPATYPAPPVPLASSPWGLPPVDAFSQVLPSPDQALGSFLAAGAEVIGDDPDFITVRGIKYMSSRVGQKWKRNVWNRWVELAQAKQNPTVWFYKFVAAKVGNHSGQAGYILDKCAQANDGTGSMGYVVLGGKYPGFIVVPRCQPGEKTVKLGYDAYQDLYGPSTRQILEAMTGPKGGWAVVDDPSPWIEPDKRPFP